MRESELWRKRHSFVHGVFEQRHAVKAVVFIERRGTAWLQFLKAPWKEEIPVSVVLLLSPFLELGGGKSEHLRSRLIIGSGGNALILSVK